MTPSAGRPRTRAEFFAAQGVLAGAYDVVVAAGVEVMTTTPMGASMIPGSVPFGPSLNQTRRRTSEFSKTLCGIAVMFVSSMGCLSSAFLMFLLEVRIATKALRIGTHQNT